MKPRIVLTGDLHRDGQRANIETVAELLRPALELIGEVSVYSDIQPVSVDEWVQTQHLDDSAFTDADYHIGFELGAAVVDRPGVVGLCLHPLRFGSDIFLGVKSPRAAACSLPPEYWRQAAARLRAWSKRVPGVRCGQKTLLICGQVPLDRSVLLEGEVHSFSRYEQQLIELTRQHDLILYKKHPMAGDPPMELLQQICLATGVGCEVVDTNIYRLLCEPQIHTVVALSSSVLAEAEWFGKTAVQLMPCAPWWQGFYPVPLPILMTEDFWRLVLMDEAYRSAPVFLHEPDVLRRICGAKWGYPF